MRYITEIDLFVAVYANKRYPYDVTRYNLGFGIWDCGMRIDGIATLYQL